MMLSKSMCVCSLFDQKQLREDKRGMLLNVDSFDILGAKCGCLAVKGDANTFPCHIGINYNIEQDQKCWRYFL